MYIRKEGTNLIDVVYNDFTDLVSNFSNYNCYPLFFTRGNINNDSYEDVIITSEKEFVDDSNEYFDENRVTFFLEVKQDT